MRVPKLLQSTGIGLLGVEETLFNPTEGYVHENEISYQDII